MPWSGSRWTPEPARLGVRLRIPLGRAPSCAWTCSGPSQSSSRSEDTEEPGRQLRKSLGPIQLTVIGIGVIIGTGIFVLTGEAAGTLAGPAIALSFVAAAIACALAGLCYAEFASVVPVAGSAYTFSYASLGELIAWIIGWDLMLELALGAATVASGWSQYFKVVLTSSPWHAHPPAWIFADGHNLVAAVVVLAITGVLCLGIRTSSTVTAVIVAIKVAIVLLVIVAGLSYIKSGNYSPFIPPSGAKPAAGGSSGTTLLQDLGAAPGAFGVGGIFSGAALVFFAFIGFDVVATNAEESQAPPARCPGRDLRLADDLHAPLYRRFAGRHRDGQVQPHRRQSAAVDGVHLGPRDDDRHDRRLWRAGRADLCRAGAADGPEPRLLRHEPGPAAPTGFSAVSERFGTPYRTTLFTGVAVAALTFFFPLKTLAELVNIGTLFAFVLVSIGVIFLRRTRADLSARSAPRSCRSFPILSVLASLWLMLNLQGATWVRFGVWMAVGLVVYFGYSRRHSRLAGGATNPAPQARARPGRAPAGGRSAGQDHRPQAARGWPPSPAAGGYGSAFVPGSGRLRFGLRPRLRRFGPPAAARASASVPDRPRPGPRPPSG